MSALPPARMITSTADLAAHVDAWAEEPLLALDTESNSLHAYREQTCLIQLSTRQADFIIDPLLIENLDPLGMLLADPQVEIVFHAAEYDVMCLKRDFGFHFAGLFDTMLAARICGSDSLGLGNMLEAFFGVKVDKKHQRANWGERPLSDEMLRYAQLDTHYLPPLRDHWRSRLLEMGRWEEARETFDELSQTPAAEHTFDPDGFWRINGVQNLKARQLSILRELYLFREDMAKQRDCPPFKVMSDRTLLELAAAGPRHEEQLSDIAGMSRGQIRRYGRGILKTIQRGYNSPPPPRPPHPPRPSDAIVARYEALHDWRKRQARKRGVESDVILSREALWALARRAPTTLAELNDIRSLGPWKVHAYGQEILAVIARADGRGPHNGYLAGRRR